MDYKSMKQAGLTYGAAKTDGERKKALNDMASIAEKMGSESRKRWTPSNPPTKEDFDHHPAVLRAERMVLKIRFKAFAFSWRGALLGLIVIGLILWAWS